MRLATQAGIPVVIIDSGLDAEVGKDFVTFIATDNEQGGRMGGQKMVELLGGKGKVLLLRYQEGSASTDLRERGFIEALSAAEGIELIDPGRYAGATRATAQEAAENLLTTYSDIDGVFCPNESSTFGMLLALRSRQMAGKVTFIGFDASEGLVEALGTGDIQALVVQNPIRMGELGVRAAGDFLQGKTIEPRIDTGVMLVTPDNMNTPEAMTRVIPIAQVPTISVWTAMNWRSWRPTPWCGGMAKKTMTTTRSATKGRTNAAAWATNRWWRERAWARVACFTGLRARRSPGRSDPGPRACSCCRG